MYARSDITQLAKGNAYNRLQWEEVTVGQALALAQIAFATLAECAVRAGHPGAPIAPDASRDLPARKPPSCGGPGSGWIPDSVLLATGGPLCE